TGLRKLSLHVRRYSSRRKESSKRHGCDVCDMESLLTDGRNIGVRWIAGVGEYPEYAVSTACRRTERHDSKINLPAQYLLHRFGIPAKGNWIELNSSRLRKGDHRQMEA